MSLNDLLQSSAVDAATKVADAASCDETPPVLTEAAMRRFAERCGKDKALSLVSKELGVAPQTLLDASTGAVDWKRAASEALNLEGLTGIPGLNDWFSQSGELDWTRMATSVGGAAASAGCLAAGAATAGVTAALAPVCGAIGGQLASWVVDGITSWFQDEDLFAPGRFIAWHVSPVGAMAMAAQYFARDGLGPTFESYAFSNPSDFVTRAADLRASSQATPLSVYYLFRQTVLEVCATVDLAIEMWEQGTGQSLKLTAQAEGKSPWRYVFDEFQKNNLGMAEGQFFVLAHEPNVLEVADMGGGFTNMGIQMHDLASFAKDRGVSFDVQRYVENPALLSVDNVFWLTRYDDPAWQKENGVSAVNEAPGDFLLQFSSGFADYYTEQGALLLAGVHNPGNPLIKSASGVTVNPLFDIAEYSQPTRYVRLDGSGDPIEWLYSVGPYAGAGSKDFAVRPAALQRVVTTTVFTYEEQVKMSEPLPDIEQFVYDYPSAYNLDPNTKQPGIYFFLPGTYWSRHLLFALGIPKPNLGSIKPEHWPSDAAIPGDRMVRAWTVGTKLPWDYNTSFDFTPIWDGEVVAYGPTKAAMDGRHDNLWVKVNKYVWRNALQHPESILAWSGGLRARLDRALGILRQYIRRWRRDNIGKDGKPKPGATVLDLGAAMKATAPLFDKLANLDAKGTNITKEVAKVSGKSAFGQFRPPPRSKDHAVSEGGAGEEPPEAATKPSAGKIALVGVGATALVLGAWYAYRKWSK